MKMLSFSSIFGFLLAWFFMQRRRSIAENEQVLKGKGKRKGFEAIRGPANDR